MNGIRKIYKYDLLVTDHVTIEMPEGAEILTVQAQQNAPRIWALVDPDAPQITRTFQVYGTGHTILCPEKLKFIGTFQLHGGSLVFHVFEEASQGEDE